MSEETFACHICGWQWKRGLSGSHDCCPQLIAALAAKDAEIARVTKERDEERQQHRLTDNARLGWNRVWNEECATNRELRSQLTDAEAEKAELRERVETEMNRGKEWCSRFIAIKKQRNELAVQLEDAKADTERLDWLNRYVIELCLTLGRVLKVDYGRDVRLVIDAARSTPRAQG